MSTITELNFESCLSDLLRHYNFAVEVHEDMLYYKKVFILWHSYKNKLYRIPNYIIDYEKIIDTDMDKLIKDLMKYLRYNEMQFEALELGIY